MSGHQDQNAAVLDQFTQQAESYAAFVRRRTGREAPGDVVGLSGVTADDRVLDVACGTGALTLDLAAIARQVTGVDLTPAMLDQARALQAERGLTNVEWVQGDALPLPFADGAFDLVVTRASFHHMADPAAMLAEMRRVSAPGGRIVVSDLTPAPDTGAAFDEMERLRDPSHTHAMPPEKLRALGRATGLHELAAEGFSFEASLEMILATSFPGPGALDAVRRRFGADADEGRNRLGFHARRDEDGLHITYPMTTVVWRAP